MVLCCVVNFEQFYHNDIMLSLNILFFMYHFFLSVVYKFRKENVVTATKHAKCTLFCCHC